MELSSIVDYGNNLYVAHLFFPDTANEALWSATTNNTDANFAFAVEFNEIVSSGGNKSLDRYLFRAVRGGQAGSLG